MSALPEPDCRHFIVLAVTLPLLASLAEKFLPSWWVALTGVGPLPPSRSSIRCRIVFNCLWLRSYSQSMVALFGCCDNSVFMSSVPQRSPRRSIRLFPPKRLVALLLWRNRRPYFCLLLRKTLARQAVGAPLQLSSLYSLSVQ